MKELSTVTSANGAYSFTNMTPDTYIVREVLKSGWKLIAPSPNFYSVSLASGAVVNNRNFGNKSVTVASNNQLTDAITASDGSSVETLTGQLANLTQNTTIIPSWQSQIKKLMEIIPGRSLTS